MVLILLIAGLLLIRPKPKTFIYGWFAGECVGNCGTMYQAKENYIIRDSISYWESDNKNKLLNIRAQQVLENDHEGSFSYLKLNIPLIMLLDPREQFGCPDCHDQGGYYLQFTMLGITRHFKIDKGNEPFYYQNLTRDLNTVMNKTLFEFKQYGR